MGARRGYVAGMGEAMLMTAEELLRLNLPDKRTELIRGRLVVRDPGGARHGAVANLIAYRITAHVEAHHLVRVYAAETGFKIQANPDTVRAPEVEVLAHDHHPPESLEKIAQ